jgi:hypothetical protein
MINFTISSLVIAKDFTLSKLNNDVKILPANIVGVDRNNTINEKLVKLQECYNHLIVIITQIMKYIDDDTKGYLDEDINIIDANITQLETMVKRKKH